MGTRWQRYSLTLLGIGTASIVSLSAVLAQQSDLPRPKPDGGASIPTAQSPTSTGQPPAAAQTPPAPETTPSLLNLDIEALQGIEVRTSSKPAPTSTGSVLTPGQGDSVLPSSIGELLEQAPDVNVKRISGINLDARVRAFNPSEINANASGVTQLKTRLDIDSVFSQINPGNVETLEVITGPYTSLYGPGFAFLNANLYGAPRYLDGYQSHGSFQFTLGTNGWQMNNFDKLWGGGPDWGYFVSFGIQGGYPYRPGDNDYNGPVPAGYQQDDTFTVLGIDPSPNTRLEFSYLHQDLYNVQLPGVAYDIAHSDTGQFNGRIIWQEDHNGPERFELQCWQQRTTYNGDASSESKQLSFFRELIGQPFPGLLGGTLINQGYLSSTGVRGLATFGTKDTLQMTVGADWRRYEQFYREADLTSTGVLFFGGVFGIPKSSLEDWGLLAHVADPITEHLTLTVGGRYDHTSTFLDDHDPVTAPPFTPGFNTPSDDLGMGYMTAELRPQDWLHLNAGVAFAMRNANLTELFTDEPFVPIVRFGNSFPDGNSNLEPEKDLQFDLGLRAENKRASIGARGFFSNIYDYILPVPSNQASTAVPAGVVAPTNIIRNLTAFGIFPNNPAINGKASTPALDYRYANIDRAELYGSEVFGEYKLLDWLALNGSLAYLRGINEDPVRFNSATNSFIRLKENESLPGIYPWAANLGVRVFEPAHNRWSVEFLIRMVDAQQHVAESMGEVPTPGFTVFGIHGSYQVNQHLRLTTAFENIFDRPYAEPDSLAITSRNGLIDFVKEPGFSWIVGVEAKF